MGYRTHFKLFTKKSKGLKKLFRKYSQTSNDYGRGLKGEFDWFNIEINADSDVEELLKMTKFDNPLVIWEDCGDARWYGYDSEMKEISEHYPDQIFLLCGEGAESLDKWGYFYKNGRREDALKVIVEHYRCGM